MNYIILKSYESGKLEEKVQSKLNQGYIPFGGLSVVYSGEPNEFFYCQAMISKIEKSGAGGKNQ